MLEKWSVGLNHPDAPWSGSPWELSRARLRLKDRGLLDVAPRLRQRGIARRYIAGAESLLAVLENARGMLAGTSAARQLGWQLPDGDWPVELYVPEAALVDVIEAYALEMASEEAVDVVLRAVPDAWPFPPHLRVVPEIVAALDLAESVTPALADLGRVRLVELGDGLEPSWDRRPQRRRSVRSIVPSSARAAAAPAPAALGSRRRGVGRPSFRRRCGFHRAVLIAPALS